MVGVMAESGRLPGPIGVGWALDESVGVGNALFGGEVVHFVVEQEAQASAVTREPKESLSVVVTATALPSASTTE